MQLYLVSESKSLYETDKVFKCYRGIAKYSHDIGDGIQFIRSLSEQYWLVQSRGEELKKR